LSLIFNHKDDCVYVSVKQIGQVIQAFLKSTM